VYEICQNLTIRNPNIHIVGEGNVEFHDAGIEVLGKNWGTNFTSNIALCDLYHPVGTKTLYVNSCPLKIGDDIRVIRRGNDEFIRTIGMDVIPERPDGLPVEQWVAPFDLEFSRKIKSISKSNNIFLIGLDESLACSIDPRWGGGYICRYSNKRISNIKLSNISLISMDNMKVGIYTDNCENVVIDVIETRNYDRIVNLGRHCRNVTVKDCKYLEPTSDLVGGNRHAFYIQGELNKVIGCFADNARHPFSFDSKVCGPNVIAFCSSSNDDCASEPHHRWSVGGLFDNVNSTIYIQNRLWFGSGQGWSGANYVCWNCNGEIVCQSPPTAINMCIGCKGSKYFGSFPNNPDGYWLNFGCNVYPESLYQYQLSKRIL
jgi:hypothetical protein